MNENKAAPDPSTLLPTGHMIPVDPTTAASAAPLAAGTGGVTDSPQRKKSKPFSATMHVSQLQALAAAQQLQPGQVMPSLPTNPPPPKITYAGIATATPKAPAATSTPPPVKISVCLEAMLAGGKMLRTSGTAPPVSPADPTSALPALGILIKSVHHNKKQWRHYALFGCTEIEITATKDKGYPDELLPSLHPGRMVCIRSDLLNPKVPIDASFLHVITGDDMQKLNDLRTLATFLPDGFGKIQIEPTGMHVKIMSSTYKYGPDDRHTYLRPIYDNLGKKHLLIPVSHLRIPILNAKESPVLEQAVLPQGTQVQFKIGIDPITGNSFAFNLRLVTILPADNCYGSPPEKMESLTLQQPGGFKVDLHVAPFGIALRSERCDLLTTHVRDRVPKESIALYITHSNCSSSHPQYASVGELDRQFRASSLKCNWNRANLDQIVEMILFIKKDKRLNDHKAAKKHFTLIFTLANQNLQNIVTNTIAESYNTHKYAGHTLLHKNVGVLLVLQPTSHSNKGIVAQVNAAQILSKAHCSALQSTHTYPPGYLVPYVMDTGGDLQFDEEEILGKSHTFLSILKFADGAKDSKLYERLIDVSDLEVEPIKVTNEVIPIQWQPGSHKDGGPSHPILSLLADKDFLMQAEVNYPKQAFKDRKKKFEDVIRTAYIKPKPGYNQSVLSTLMMHKDILILPDNALEDDGFLLRFSRPYPAEAFELVKHRAAKFSQFLSPYALRFIYDSKFGNEIIPEVLKMDKTVAHFADNISLAHTAGSPWNEIIANNIHSTLGRTLLPPIVNCPNSVYIGGFTGFPTTEYLQFTLFNDAVGAALLVVDSPEETSDGGVFVQYLKSSIRPASLHAKDVTLSIYSNNTNTQELLRNMANVISFLSLGSLYPVRDGLQFLTVQANAVSTAKGDIMGEEALSKIKAKIHDPPEEIKDQQDSAEQDYQPYPETEEKKEEEFKEHHTRRSERNKSKADNTSKQQTKQANTTTTNKQQERKNKGNQYMNLNKEDEEVFNDPAVVAVATQNSPRRAEAGDFDTSKDWRITGYLKDKWQGQRPEELTIKIAKLVVTVWARSYPDYQTHQLGNNFTGKTKLGGLLTTVGKTLSIKGRAITVVLNDCIRNFTSIDSVCRKLEDMIQQADKQTNNNVQQQPQQQPTTKPPATPTHNKAPSQPVPRTSNKTISPNCNNQTTITSHYNPLNSIVQDLTLSQEEQKSNTQVVATDQSDVIMLADEGSSPDADQPNAHLLNPSNDPGTDSSAVVNYSLNGGTGGMPATILALPETAAADGSTDY